MKQLIPLLGDQARLVPYPINCPVYIYKDAGDEEFGSAAVANGKVSGVFLRMNKTLSSPELIYNIDLHAKEESDLRRGIQQSELNNSSKSQMVLAKQLRLRNGCPVYVKCKDGRNYSPADDGNRFERKQGIVLGTCDMPLYDGRRNHSDNAFWYSVQFLTKSNDKEGGLSTIMHEISPENVSFRDISPSISKYTIEQTKGEPMSPIEKFENTAVTGDLDENVVLDLVKTVNPREKTREVKGNKAVSPPQNRRVGFENDRTYPPKTNNNANAISDEDVSPSKHQRQPDTQINERNDPQTSPPTFLNGYNRNDSELDMSNMRTPNNQENLNQARHIITPTSSKRSARGPSFPAPLTNIGSNPNGRMQKNATNMSKNNMKSKNPRPPPKDFEYHAVLDFATQKSLLFHVIVGKGGKNHRILMKDTSCFLSLGGDEDSSQIFVYSESAKNVEYGVGKCLSTVLRYLPVHLGPGSAGEVRWVYDNAVINYFRHNLLVSTRNGFDSRLSPVRRTAASAPPNLTNNHLFRLVLPGSSIGEIQSIVIGRAGGNIELLLRKTGLSKIFVRDDDSSGNPYVEAVGRSPQVAESGAYAILEFVQNAMKRRISEAYVTNGQFRASAEFV